MSQNIAKLRELILLPLLVPLATTWVARQERRILARGVPLHAAQRTDATAAGVGNPERIRLLRVPAIPFADQPKLQRLAITAGLLRPHIAGLTARYGIFIRSDRWHDREVLVHELAHTAQYERLGSIRLFLRRYLQEWLRDGYPLGELELEAAEIARRVAR